MFAFAGITGQYCTSITVLVTTTTCWNLFKPDAQWSEGGDINAYGGSELYCVFCTLGRRYSNRREL